MSGPIKERLAKCGTPLEFGVSFGIITIGSDSYLITLPIATHSLYCSMVETEKLWDKGPGHALNVVIQLFCVAT